MTRERPDEMGTGEMGRRGSRKRVGKRNEESGNEGEMGLVPLSLSLYRLDASSDRRGIIFEVIDSLHQKGIGVFISQE